jgi:hypothetical protein
MKHEPLDPQFAEPPFQPITAEAARTSDGLVWWRPDGVLTLDNPDKDLVLVRRG